MKLIIGAGGKTQEGWIATEQSQLDMLNESDFIKVLDGAIGFENILIEHCLEHVSPLLVINALTNCYNYLSVSGRLRIAVPDGLHPDPEYIKYVSPPNTGHKELYTYKTLGRLLKQVGFRVIPVEWWDERGKFHTTPWYESDGNIERSLSNDERNNDGKPHYTSLIMDGVKDKDVLRPGLEKAFEFVENNDPNRVSAFNRKKTMTFYELARLAPAGGSIVELGAYHGIGTAALWYGARDGHRCPVISVDAYEKMNGWAGEPYLPEDKLIWEKNMWEARIQPKLIVGDSTELSKVWKDSISLLLHDLGSRNRMPQDVLEWERHIIKGGLIALRDIDNYSMGTEKAIENLIHTGRWGKRRNWEAFITSLERIV